MSTSRLPNCAYCGGFLSRRSRVLYEFPMGGRRFHSLGWHGSCAVADAVWRIIPCGSASDRDALVRAIRRRGSGRVLRRYANPRDGVM